MQLSIIIVNYNVKHFLEQCLCSVQRAIGNLQTEVFVVDNNSNDGSIEYLSLKFPSVRFIINEENLGFAKACNLGLKNAIGKYVLFLNPDSLVQEDTFEKCISFLAANPLAGATGIKMLDGKGLFLKESKRSFPSPSTSLFKLFGLSKIFPRSKLFAKYHLGHLDKNKNHEVDVLAGAFMMIKAEVLQTTGGFDEVFFMYGEDIDLSYRIQKAGYKNFYFAESSIIHFKGESSKKGSMNYVRLFYKAMSLFVKKHYGAGRAGMFNFFIQLAIWFRACMSAISGFIRKIGLPLLDASLILLSFWLIKNFWSAYIKPHTNYSNELLWIMFPLFTILNLTTAYYAGLYDRWYKEASLLRATLIACIALLVSYSLLPEDYRFSRGMLLFGALLAFVLQTALRWLLKKSGVLVSHKQKNQHASILVVGSINEFEEIEDLLGTASLNENLLGRVAVDGSDEQAITGLQRLGRLSTIFTYREIIFCVGYLSFEEIIKLLSLLPKKVGIRFHFAGSTSIVGSDSKDSVGEALSSENGFKMSHPYNKRIKRLIDVFVAAIGIIGFPIHLLFVKKPFQFLKNCLMVFIGKKTWVGYLTSNNKLPVLKQTVIGCNGLPFSMRQMLSERSRQLLDNWYALEYEPIDDLILISKLYRKLGE